MEPVVIARNVTKIYPRKPQLMRSRENSFLKLINRRATGRHLNDKKFWALTDVSFEINSGESVCLIGSNGAGKSTLLRILTGITKPTSGHVKVNGNYGELFALNSGFNKDLSGRKNIYLLGAIKGFSKESLDEKIQEIVEFSELGDFIDQPVKVYSSGMRGRLGFSILIHLLPDIIFIDEALSTGDKKFQQKCTKRLNEWSQGGKTLVIVSHAAPLLREICTRAIWLDHGKVKLDGEVNQVLSAYDNAK